MANLGQRFNKYTNEYKQYILELTEKYRIRDIAITEQIPEQTIYQWLRKETNEYLFQNIFDNNTSTIIEVTNINKEISLKISLNRKGKKYE